MSDHPRGVPADFRLPWNTTKTMAGVLDAPYEAGIKSHYADVRARLARPAPKPLPVQPDALEPVAAPDAPAPVRVTARSIIDAVCAKHNIARKELLSRSRRTPVVICRHEAMYRMRAEVLVAGRPMSLPEIGRKLGGLDHTTVWNGILRHEARMKAAA